MATTFLSGNLDKFGIENDKISRRCGDYYGYFEEGKLKGVLTFFNLGSVMPHFESSGAVNAFAEIMRQRKFEVVAGMKYVVEPLFQAVVQHKKVLAYEDSYYFVNNKFNPYTMQCDGLIADAEQVDRSLAIDFVVEAYRQGFRRRFNREMAAKMLDERAAGEDFIFLLTDGKPRAQAAIQVITSRIKQIGGVYTSEDSRGRGYCKALVSELCRRIIASGKTPTLMSRKDNIPAVKAYQAVGFEYFDDYLMVKFVI
ncbi:GNAT family N-acetyltransferase [Sporomusa carbonis]|uniref:GNAT family N-acetyltransferase n=1 Tax=Sporomusa carbonis TaxID=3076075 RepID=UPI003C7E4A67